jgi:hypothetical protein
VVPPFLWGLFWMICFNYFNFVALLFLSMKKLFSLGKFVDAGVVFCGAISGEFFSKLLKSQLQYIESLIIFGFGIGRKAADILFSAKSLSLTFLS